MPTTEQLVGEQFEGQRGRYILERYLGAGLTAHVYQASDLSKQINDGDPVAVKVMRTGLGPLEAERFRAEASSLAGLQGARALAAPQYHEHFVTGRSDVPEILVLELMTGAKVEDILVADGPFAEKEAVSLGVQLFDLLNILHSQLQRTYTDFKFENLWWERDQDQLKVTDWNVLSDFGQMDRASSDLLRASRYLYRILTGSEAREQGGIVETPYTRHPNWTTLSLACKNILKQALHRYPEQRYATAAVMLEGLRRVQNYWTLTHARLLSQAEGMVNGPYQRATYQQAQEILDVLRLRQERGELFSPADGQTLNHLRQQVDDRLNAEQTALERGQHLFRGNSFREAESWFIQVVGEDPWNAVGWRWREAARAGAVTSEFARHTGDVERALNALESGEYPRAENALPTAVALDGIRSEIRMRRGLLDAERLTINGHRLVEAGRGDSPEADDLFKQAQTAFGAAADALGAVTPSDYREMLRQEVGDPAKRGRELVDAQRSAVALAGRMLRSAQEKVQAGRWQTAAEDIAAGLEAAPGEPRLLELCLRHGKEQFAAGNLATAVDLFALASRYETSDGLARWWWRAAAGVARVENLTLASQDDLALDGLAAVVGLLLPGEVAETAASQLQRLVDERLERAEDMASLAELGRWLAAPSGIARLTPSRSAWAADVERSWPAAIERFLAARQTSLEPANFLDLIGSALAIAPAVARQPLAEKVQPLLSRTLAAVPATQDLERSGRVLRSAQALREANPELAASSWSSQVAEYRTAFEQEQDSRRQTHLEADQQIVEALIVAGDRDSLRQARDRLDEAKVLTPSESRQYEGLLVLERRLAQLETDQLSSGERRQRVDRAFGEFEGRLGTARSDSEFSALSAELEDARSQAQRLQDHIAMDACTEKLALIVRSRDNRRQSAMLEARLSEIRGQLTAVADLGDQPGAAAVQDGLWRELLATSDQLQAIHPFHSDALQAHRDYQDHSKATTLQARMAYVEAVTGELGQPYQQFRQAEACWLGAEPDKATPLLQGLPPEWQATEPVRKLTADAAAGATFLSTARSLTQVGLTNDSFDQGLIKLLSQRLPPNYLAKSALPGWLESQRTTALGSLASAQGVDRKRTPALLAQVVSADQGLRLVNGAQRNEALPGDPAGILADGFVDQTLPLLASKQRREESLNAALAGLPLGMTPAAWGRQTEQAAAARLAKDRGANRSRLLKRAALAVGGLALLALLIAVLGWIWPGFLPDSRASLLGAAETATANPPTPVQVAMRETVVVIHTATATLAPPTDTPAPPTDTPLPPPTDTPTPTLTPVYQDSARIAAVLSGLNAPFRPDGVQAPSREITATDYIAVLDNADPGASFEPGSDGGAAPTLVTDATLGVLSGMQYLATTPDGETPRYAWPTVASMPQGTYRLFVFVPGSHGTVAVDYTVDLVAANGSAVEGQPNEQSMGQVEQGDRNDEWVDLGEFTVNEVSNVRVLAQAIRGTATGQAAFDAVAIVGIQ